MKELAGIRAKVHRHPRYRTPKKIYDFHTPPRRGTPRRIATAFLGRIAKDLKIDTNPRDLRFDKVVESILGSHVLFQQYHRGKPVTGAWLKIDLDKQNRIYSVENGCVPSKVIERAETAKSAAMMDEEAAIQKAIEVLRATPAGRAKPLRLRSKPVAEMVFFPGEKTVSLAWKIILPVADPPHDWRMYIRAANGSLLHKEDMLKMATARGYVFDPTPVAVLNDTRLKPNSSIPNNAYRLVDLPDVAGTGFLDGPYVSTRDTKRRRQNKNGQFLLKHRQRAFKEVMVYFHIDRVQRYIQSLGLANVNNRCIPVDIDGISDDNSYYSPATKSLTFGTGGVDDAEDAEIILHEYGHSIQDNQVPGFGSSNEAAAMGEGFGDYLAASFFESLKPARLRQCVGSWDATAYSPEDPPCLRRVDSTKRYPRDLVQEEHADGEIWSACLWQIREAIGRTDCDRLVLAHHFLVKRDSSFADAALALILVDRNLYGGAHEKIIRDVFIRRGILKTSKRQRAGYDPYARSNRRGSD